MHYLGVQRLAMATVSAELDEETKRKAEAVLGPRGFSTASVIQMMFTQIAEGGALPFDYPEFNAQAAAAVEATEAMKALLTKIRTLPPERQTEVEDFVEFVQQREELRSLRHDFTEASESAFAKVWDNPLDAIYDDI
jgi:addiction module RelB/DinJ family antitoxin